MNNFHIRHFRGGVAVVGTGVDQFVEKYRDEITSLQEKHQFNPIQCPYHITLFEKQDRNHLQYDDDLVNSTLSRNEIESFGVGGNVKKKNFFIVVVWPGGQKILQNLNLPPRNFHITISHQNFENDVINHGFASLFYDIEEKITSFSHKQMTFFLYQFAEIDKDYDTALRMGYKLAASHRSQEILLQIGDIYFLQGKYKIALLFYLIVFDQMNPTIQAKVKNKIALSLKHTETFGLFLENELEEFRSIPQDLRDILITSTHCLADLGINYQRTSHLTHLISQNRLYTHESREMPRFFSSLVPDFIGLMSSPRYQQDVDILAKLNFKYVVTLTRENPLPKPWFQNTKIENVFLPITDGKPPVIAEMNWIIQFLMTAYRSHNRVLIHCGGGKGRAGTVAACYLALFQSKPPIKRDKPVMSAQEAISTIRNWRPGSLETPEQERFVSEWVSYCWKSDATQIEEPEGEALEIVGDPQYLSKSKLILLVGLPGSGKSWLATALEKKSPHLFNIISRDLLRDKNDLLRQISTSKRNIIDQCNIDSSTRKKWLNSKLNPVAIIFDYPPRLCQQRVSLRLNHATIPINGGERAIENFFTKFQKPSLDEGFHAIVTIKNFNNVQNIIDKISLIDVVPSHKFPRTFHAMNLGAATRDDLVMSQSSWLLLSKNSCMVIEEKVDGANLGLCLSGFDLQIRAHNRGHYVNSQSHLQFKRLDRWISSHYNELLTILNRDSQYPERYILYGEWMVLKHSIHYQTLPDIFLVFDLYDRLDKTFSSRDALSQILTGSKLHQVPLIGRYDSKLNLRDFVDTPSKYYDGPVEGVYIRFERDNTRETVGRAKVVRSDFLSSEIHWKNSNPVYNTLSP